MNQSPEFHLACACDCACWMGHCLTKVSVLSCALLPYETHLVHSILLQVYTLFFIFFHFSHYFVYCSVADAMLRRTMMSAVIM